MPGKALTNFLTRLFGSRNRRTLKELGKIVDVINGLEKQYEALSDQDLKELTGGFRARLEAGSTLPQLLPEAFSAVREASKRTLGMRHFDVQLLGGLVLTRRAVAEMRTGEGKTLTSTLPAYLYALSGRGVHVVTVNEYLAQRDAKTNSALFEALGLRTGVIVDQMSSQEKQRAYAADITYGTGSGFCFDYLRDNMVYRPEDRVQRGLYYALLDEVDSILIDEARTPLIISGPSESDAQYYLAATRFIPGLVRQEKPDTEEHEGDGDYYVDEKLKQVHLTERGLVKAEEWLVKEGLLPSGLSLYDSEYGGILHALQAALKAHALFRRDTEYIVHKDEALIIDENTGRVMAGRRWSDGLHQAVEAKEGIPIQPETQTLASISYQNYFRLYEHLSGMTGTADTEALEFQQIYQMDTVVVPTNRPMIRKDLCDRLAASHVAKLEAIATDIEECLSRQQPVLVGTVSIEKSEELSALLRERGIEHEVLNARYHEKEAEIIAQAGRPGRVTIATNMAGRGTDIILGGSLQAEWENNPSASAEERAEIFSEWKARHEAVLASGGLHVIGTERHDSRRVDNQLRGRSGRQGDPGSSCFYASLEDGLLKNFLPNYILNVFRSYCEENGLLIHPLVASRIEQAQRLTESRDFDLRKNLLEYDDVASEHRKVLYWVRNLLLETDDLTPALQAVRRTVLNRVVQEAFSGQAGKAWNHSERIRDLVETLETRFRLRPPIEFWLERESGLNRWALQERILAVCDHELDLRLYLVDPRVLQSVIRQVFLRTMDQLWQEHLVAMDKLKEYIHLRGYAQREPKQEYKKEAYLMFKELFKSIETMALEQLAQIQLPPRVDASISGSFPSLGPSMASGGLESLLASELESSPEGPVRPLEAEPLLSASFETDADGAPLESRNRPCPCGSGQRYKYCHGAIETAND